MRKPQKQLTLDKLPTPQPKPAQPAQPKKLTITELAAQTGIDELTLKVTFQLHPTKAAFSKVKADLWFEKEALPSALIRIPQGPLATDELEYRWVLDMTGVAAGQYTVKVLMYEVWGSSEKLGCTERELQVNYVPQKRQSRYVRVPTVKSVAGADLAVTSKTESEIYKGIKDAQKREQENKRDSW
jgi:hypothetical protein